MPSTPGTVNFPSSLDDDVSLLEATNNAATTLSGSISDADTTITVSSTTLFPSTGALSIESEIVFYTGTTSTTFTGCLRGQDGTSAAAHDSGVSVNLLIIAAHHNTSVQAILALEAKVGVGTSTPDSGDVLLGTSAGSSEWGTLPDATTSSAGLMSAADKVALDAAASTANFVFNEVPSGTVDGSNTVFTTASNYLSGTTALYLNGLRQTLNSSYSETGSDEITFSSAPQVSDEIIIDYIVA